MNALRFLIVWAMACVASTAAGQPAPPKAPVARTDVTGAAGWLNTHTSDLFDTPYDRWHNSGVEGSAMFGWYWTDHLKTEVEASRSTTGTVYGYEELRSATQVVYRQIEYTIAGTHVAFVQQYQFRRNVFFHPYAGTGLDLGWETLRGTAQPTLAYSPGTGSPIEVKPAEPLGRNSQFRARWLAETGFKAYLSQRAFFRSDVRFAGAARLNSVLLRFGFGVDF